MKKKICHIITRFLNGGAEENTLITCNYSAKLGDQVTLITGINVDKEIILKLDKRVKLIKIKNLVREIKPIDDYLAFLKIFKILKKLRPDIVHTHESKAGIIGRFCAKFSNVQVIIHSVHILPFVNVNFFNKFFYLFLEKITSFITDYFICVSKGMMQEMLKYKIASLKKCEVIHSGFDIKKFQKAKKNFNLINNQQYRKKPNKFKILLMMGAFEKRKKQIEFLNIFDDLLKRHTNLLLVIVGAGQLLNQAKKKVSILKLKDRVFFAGFRNDPENFIALSDICIMNSIREGLPRVIPQFIAAGKPVITSNLVGIEEIVKNNKNGFIFKRNKKNELYKKVDLVLKNKKLLSKLSNGARNTNISKWSMHRMSKKINLIYESLLKYR